MGCLCVKNIEEHDIRFSSQFFQNGSLTNREGLFRKSLNFENKLDDMKAEAQNNNESPLEKEIKQNNDEEKDNYKRNKIILEKIKEKSEGISIQKYGEVFSINNNDNAKKKIRKKSMNKIPKTQRSIQSTVNSISNTQTDLCDYLFKGKNEKEN